MKLKQTISALSPDFIISTRNYTQDDLSLAALGVPFRMVMCDYEVSYFMLPIYGRISDAILKFWLPSHNALTFRPFFEHHNRLDFYSDEDDFMTCAKKMAQIIGVPFNQIANQFECLGYPIHSAFYRVTDLSTRREWQTKWGVNYHDHVVCISMGKNGEGNIKQIFECLVSSSVNLPAVKCFFVCGRHAELKALLQKKLAELSPAQSSRFTILGLIDFTQMNELLNISHIHVTKTGGAVTSEALVTGTYLLSVFSHLWEQANEAMVIKQKMGEKVEGLDALPATLSQRLPELAGKLQTPQTPPNDWQAFLDTQFTAMIPALNARRKSCG